MRVRLLPTSTTPPQHPDECADCGEWMNSMCIGPDRLARCVSCDMARRRAAKAAARATTEGK